MIYSKYQMINISLFVILPYLITQCYINHYRVFYIYSVCKIILKSCNLLIETHRLVEWKELTTPQRNTTLNNLGQDFMDIRRFFLVSIQWLVGVTMDVLCKYYGLLTTVGITNNIIMFSVINLNNFN